MESKLNKNQLIIDLLNQIKSGDTKSVGYLYEQTSPLVWYIAFQYLQSEQEADELAQDFWLNIQQYAQKFIFNKNAIAYLCAIMTRLALNRCKHLKKEQRMIQYEKLENVITITPIDRILIRQDIKDAMSNLSGREKRIIEDSFFFDKTIRQISAEMGISKSNVSRIRLHAIEVLRIELNRKGWDKNNL